MAVDDVDVPAAAVASLATKLSQTGRRVCLVDVTATRALGRAIGAGSAKGSQSVSVAGGGEVMLVTPRQPWEPDEGGQWEYDPAVLANAEATLVVATVKPTVGAWHLRTWATDAIITVTAGRSTVQETNTVAELLDAADITAASAVLLGADADDESVGLPEPGAAAFGHRHRQRQRLDLVHTRPSPYRRERLDHHLRGSGPLPRRSSGRRPRPPRRARRRFAGALDGYGDCSS